MRKLLLISCLLFSGCVVSEIAYKGGIGEELRGHDGKPSDQRFSVKSGLEAKVNDITVGASYRNRITEFEKESLEHGFFIDVKVPLWRKR